MIDIHTHIIPGIDDGAPTLQQSIAMAREYQKCGFNAVIATPHIKEGRFNNTKERIFEETENLNVDLACAGISLDVYTGAEYFMDIRILQDCENNTIVTLGNSGYVLIELPRYNLPKYTNTIVTFLLKNGFIPVIAHPERCGHIQEHGYHELFQFLNEGCKIQIDIPSLLGSNGKRAMKTGWSILKEGMAETISFDAHTPDQFKNILEQLESMISEPRKGFFRQLFDVDQAFINTGGLELKK